MELSEHGTVHIDKYYGSLGSMLTRYEENGRRDAVVTKSVEAFEEWQKKAQKTLKGLLGIDRLRKAPANARVEEEERLSDGITRRKVVLQTEEDVFMPMDILIPEGEPKGVFLALPGHQGGGRFSVAGYYDVPVVKEKIDFFNYDYGRKLARLGYVAVCPDCRGFGERRDEYLWGDEAQRFLGNSCRNLAHMALPMGLTVTGLNIFDYIVLIDYLEAAGEWDLSTLGCLGFSGGGMQTLYLCALEPRIRQAFVSGYFYGFRDSLMVLNGNCDCNYIPRLWEHFDVSDLAAMYAPRPLLIQSCRDDHLNGPRGLLNVMEQLEILKEVYALCGKEGNLKHDIRDGEHHFHDEPLENTLKEFQVLLQL